MNETEFDRWYDKILRFLSFRPRSKKEITDYLVKHKIADQIQKKLIEKLEQQNLINDADFARWFVEQRNEFRPKGKKLLALELKQKGIAQEEITAALTDSPSELEQATSLISKKLVFWQKLPTIEQKKKIYGFLGRRGFGWEIIKKVIAEVITNNGENGQFDEN